MIKLLVGAMKQMLEGAAFIIIAGSAYFAYTYASALTEDSVQRVIYTLGGLVIGLVLSVILLGIPALLLRINENLEKLDLSTSKILKNCNSQTSARGDAHPFTAGFPNQAQKIPPSET